MAFSSFSYNNSGTFYRYLYAKLVVGLYKQITNSPKFLMVLRKCLFESSFEVLKTDARHLIRDTDKKIHETLSRTITKNNLSSISRTLEHRVRTGFMMCFSSFNQDLSRFFRLKFGLNANYLSGADILSDLDWTDVVEDDDLKSLVYGILGDLNGHDLPLHPIENTLKVFIISITNTKFSIIII